LSGSLIGKSGAPRRIGNITQDNRFGYQSLSVCERGCCVSVQTLLAAHDEMAALRAEISS
jgi:hypothetical protein